MSLLSSMSTPTRKGLGLQSKTGRKDTIKREKTDLRKNDEEIFCCSKKLIEILFDGGVSESYCDEIRVCFSIKEEVDDGSRDESNQQLIDSMNYLVQADNAVDKAWSFALCYPSM